MASFPGYLMEDYLEDSWFHFHLLNDECKKEFVKFFEPARESIETQLDTFDEEERNWRDYRNSMNIDPIDIDKAGKLIRELDEKSMPGHIYEMFVKVMDTIKTSVCSWPMEYQPKWNGDLPFNLMIIDALQQCVGSMPDLQRKWEVRRQADIEGASREVEQVAASCAGSAKSAGSPAAAITNIWKRKGNKMSSDYLIVFPATTTYLDEARVLLRSLQANMPHIPVHVMTRRNEAAELKEFPNVEEIIDEKVCSTEFRQIRTSRFRHAVDLSDKYKVVCLLDADMCCVRDFTVVFKMAEAGAILVGSNNTLLRYVKKDFDKLKIFVRDDIDVVHPTFTTVPTFINPTIHKEYLNKIWSDVDNPTGNDLESPNLIAASMGIMDQVYLLPSHLFTNIHHSMLKPELYVKTTSGGLYSNQGEPVYIIHGHWLDEKGYIPELLSPMKKNYGYNPKYVECAKNCIQVLKTEYDKYTKDL